jgi:hypothetical protein
MAYVSLMVYQKEILKESLMEYASLMVLLKVLPMGFLI